MNKRELIEQIAQSHSLTARAAKQIVDDVFDTIVAKVKKGEDVSILGFGTFKRAARAARKGLNPKTGQTIKIAASKTPKFTAGKSFKDAVNGKAAAKPTPKAAKAAKPAKTAAAPAKSAKKKA